MKLPRTLKSRAHDLNWIFARVIPEPNSGCWIWGGALGTGGYANTSLNNRHIKIHRMAWMLVNGPIPDGLEIDHKCRVRSCVNPDHLEAVTHLENVRRGIASATLAARNAAIVTCPKGHPYSGKNLILRKSGSRQCRECNRQRLAKKRQNSLTPLMVEALANLVGGEIKPSALVLPRNSSRERLTPLGYLRRRGLVQSIRDPHKRGVWQITPAGLATIHELTLSRRKVGGDA